MPDLPQRRSIRLPHYDYQTAGWYFITIATHQHSTLLGRVQENATVLPTPIGDAVCQAWHELSCRYPQVHADAWVLMPNHVHFVLGLLPAEQPKPLGQLVGAFKATATRLARPCLPTGAVLWQRNYYEHVIRHARALANIRQYIRDNPRRWVERLHGLPATCAVS